MSDEPAGQDKPAATARASEQQYDYDDLVAAARTFAGPDDPPVRPESVIGALALYAHEHKVKDVQKVRLSRDEMVKALDAWSSRPDPTYTEEEG